MRLFICPSIHPAELTQQFLQGIEQPPAQALVFPSSQPPYSPLHVLKFLHQQLSAFPSRGAFPGACSLQSPLVWISFSAGVVGAIGAAQIWQGLGGQVQALIALDGWGVPLFGNFPIHRLSHDRFTHWSSALLGAGNDSFYADPAVPHLRLWQAPQTVLGWHCSATRAAPSRCTAAQFLHMLLLRYSISN